VRRQLHGGDDTVSGSDLDGTAAGGRRPGPLPGDVVAGASDRRRRVLDWGVYAAYRAAAGIAQIAPGGSAPALGRLGGVLYGRVDRRRRDLVRAHLRRLASWATNAPAGSVPAVAEEEVDEVFASYGEYWATSFRLARLSDREIAEGVMVDGIRNLDASLRTGRGAILVLPHLGGWDVGGAWMGVRGYAPLVVVEQLRPELLHRWFTRQRARVGLRVLVPEPTTVVELLAALRRGELVGLVADRDLSGNGAPVTMFGAPTTLPLGPAVLALRSGAALHPAAVYAIGRGRHRAVIRPPLELPAPGPLRARAERLTGALGVELERLISAAPTQWHLVQPYWQDERPP